MVSESMRLSIIVTMIRERWAAKGSSNSFKNADFGVVSESMRLSIIGTSNRERWAVKGSSNSLKTPILALFQSL